MVLGLKLVHQRTPTSTTAHRNRASTATGPPPLETPTCALQITLTNGLTWLLYASAPLELDIRNVLIGGVLQTIVQGTGPFTGVLRAAVAPSAQHEALYDANHDIVVTGERLTGRHNPIHARDDVNTFVLA